MEWSCQGDGARFGDAEWFSVDAGVVAAERTCERRANERWSGYSGLQQACWLGVGFGPRLALGPMVRHIWVKGNVLGQFVGSMRVLGLALVWV